MSSTYKTQDTSMRTDRGSLVYDPVLKIWVESSVSNASTDGGDITTEGEAPPETPSDVVDNNPESSVNSTGEAAKEYIETEFNILTGDIELRPSEKTIKLRVNSTVTLEGVGKYLSGTYYVTAVRRNISASSGFSMSISVSKNGFGDSLKGSNEVVISETLTPRTEVPEVPLNIDLALHVNDSVRIVGDDAVYSNAHDGVIVPNWVKQKTLTIVQISKDETRVLLSPINSWTYTKYIEKV